LITGQIACRWKRLQTAEEFPGKNPGAGHNCLPREWGMFPWNLGQTGGWFYE